MTKSWQIVACAAMTHYQTCARAGRPAGRAKKFRQYKRRRATSVTDHAATGLQQLHWLPVKHRITFKLCMLMHLIHVGRAPRYMADSVQSIVESSRRPGLRSADTADYVKHRLQSKFGERCFS